jgi:hypothetical protein
LAIIMSSSQIPHNFSITSTNVFPIIKITF